MNVVDPLLTDHYYIARMLVVLERAAERLVARQWVDPEMLTGIGGYLEHFVACHERKETELLFPRLRDRFPALHADAVPGLLTEHRRGQVLRTELADALTSADVRTIESLAVAYCRLKRPHLRAEDTLFARVRSVGPDPAAPPIHVAFAELEREHLGATGREWYTQVAIDYSDIVSTWKER